MQTLQVTPDTKAYVVSRKFYNPAQAAEAFNRLNEIGRQRMGSLDIGIYRHGVSVGDASYITVVSLKRESIEFVEGILGGLVHVIAEEMAVALVLRRLRVVSGMQASGVASGSYSIRRGRRGGRLHKDGRIDERVAKDE